MFLYKVREFCDIDVHVMVNILVLKVHHEKENQRLREFDFVAKSCKNLCKCKQCSVLLTGTMFRLKGAILTMSFLDCNGVLIPSVSEQWRDRENKEKEKQAHSKSLTQTQIYIYLQLVCLDNGETGRTKKRETSVQ